MQKYLNTLALTAVVSLVGALTAQAQNIANDPIGYNTGSGIATQTGSGSGFQAQAVGVNAAGGFWNSKADPNAANEVQATSLAYTDGSGNTLTTSGGSLVSQTPNGTTSQPQLMTTSTFGALGAANGAAPGTLWMSYLWQGLNTTGSGGLGIYRQSIAMFITGATSTTAGTGSERLDIGMPNIPVGGVAPNISLWDSGGLGQHFTSTAPQQSTVAANNGQTAFVLIEFTLDNTTTTADTINVWINPTLGVYTPGALGTPNLSLALQDLSAINGIRFQNAGTNAADGFGGERVDEINIGDTAQDVETFTSVPEPTSLALAGLGGFGFLTWLRRRK